MHISDTLHHAGILLWWTFPGIATCLGMFMAHSITSVACGQHLKSQCFYLAFFKQYCRVLNTTRALYFIRIYELHLRKLYITKKNSGRQTWYVTTSKNTYFKEIIEALLTSRQLVQKCVQNLVKIANSAQRHNFTLLSNISHNRAKILVHSSESGLVLWQCSSTKYGLEIHPPEITAR